MVPMVWKMAEIFATFHFIGQEDRQWHILPSAQKPEKPWLLQFVLETLRHENRHHPVDGAMLIRTFMKRMTHKIWALDEARCREGVISQVV